MIRSGPQSRNAWRHVMLTLAAVAVVLKVLVPPGFMLASARTNDLPFAIVLCTGQGMVTVAPGEILPGQEKSDHGPAEPGQDGPVCVFAGHGLAAAPPLQADLGRAGFARRDAVPHPIILGLAPGRGLSGPPLPARGPPVTLI